MTSFDTGETLAERFRNHAGASTHLYGYATRGMADDWEAGGPVRQVCAGYEQAPKGAALQLRLLAGVFRLVLTGRAPELARFYPSAGGEDPPDGAWPVMRQVIESHLPELHAALETAPQTNEVGRSAALLAGLFDVVAASGCTRFNLLELGASAGLNLLVDAYGYAGAGWRWGVEDSPVQLGDAIAGRVRPQSFTIDSRRGCDLHPVDAATEEGQLLLTSFVWPFDLVRHARLAAALPLAVAQPPAVARASASEWLPEQLALSASEGGAVLSVVWHSITELYWPPKEIAGVRDVLERHGSSHPLAHIGMEYNPDGAQDAKPEVTTELWQPALGDRVRRRVIGTAHDHGVPVWLTPES